MVVLALMKPRRLDPAIHAATSSWGAAEVMGAENEAAPPIPSPVHGEDRVVIVLALAGGLALLALALFLLAPLGPTVADPSGLDQVQVVDPDYLKPEPRERFLYIAGVLLLPFCLGGVAIGVRRLRRSPQVQRSLTRLSSPVTWLMTPLVLGLFLAGGFADQVAVVRSLTPGGTVSFAVAVALALGTVATAGSRFRDQTDRLLRFLLPALAGLVFLGVLCFNILGPEHVRNIPVFWASFNAFFYSVVQVFFGKELLVDFINQYGLYPHFLEPVFRLVGLSIYSFTVLMGLLNCLAFFCMYRFLARETGDGLLAFLGLATIVFTGYVALRVEGRDLYLQYHPLRTLFPAISLLVVRAFARVPSRRTAALLFALGAVALLWNPDTGAIVLAAGFLVVVYDALLRRRPREIPVRLLLGAAAAAAVIVSFSASMWLRYGAIPDFGRLLLYPRGFYFFGVMMLPMPRFGLWVPVLLIYAAGLLLALLALVKGEETPRARVYFFLSVLGLGLFTYYQGRSHLGNLLAAWYPAILIGVLLASDLRRSALSRARPADRLLFVTLLALLWYSVPALAAVAPAWVREIAAKVRVTARKEEGEVVRDARFLSNYVRPGQEVVILSYNSGLHHLLTRTTNPLDIPSDSELIYRKDFERQIDYVASGRGMFVIDKNTLTPGFLAATRRANPVFYDNPYGTLVVFPARRPADPR